MHNKAFRLLVDRIADDLRQMEEPPFVPEPESRLVDTRLPILIILVAIFAIVLVA